MLTQLSFRPMPSIAPPHRRAAPLPPEARRAAIIDAVLPLLVTHGESVTTRQLAQAAGIAEGTIFNVFADKDELLAAAVAKALDPEPFELAIGAISTSAPFEQRLTEATLLLQHRIVDIWRLVSSIGRREQIEGPLPDSPALTELFVSVRRHLSVEPGEAARLLRALTLSLTHPMLAASPAPAARIVDVFLHGVGRRR